MIPLRHPDSESHRSWFIKGVIGGASVRLIGAALGFATVVILARMLGPAEFGAYAFVIALISFLSVPVQFGLPTLVVRETARAQKAGELEVLVGLWRWSTLVVAGIGAVISLTVVSSIFLFPTRIPDIDTRVLYWGLALLPLIALNSLKGAALRGLRYVVLGQIPETILRPSLYLLLLCSGLIWWLPNQPTATDAMRASVFAGVASLVIASYLLATKRPKRPTTNYTYHHRSWFIAMWPLALVAGLLVLNSHIDILMLGILSSSENVGVYRVVVQGASLVVFVLQIVNIAIAPHITRIYASGEADRLQALVTQSARLALLGALPVTLTLIVFGYPLLRIIFGVDYAAGYSALVILAIGQLCNAGMGSVGLLLNMTGHERETARGVGLAVMLNIPLNIILIPLLGLNGAALATTISLLVWNIVLWRSVKAKLGLTSTAFSFGPRARAT